MTANWTVTFAAAALDDLTLIEVHLAESYESFGESPAEARSHAISRIDAILTGAERIATAPRRGAVHEDLIPGLRHLTIDRAIYWYLVDEAQQRLRILAVFFGPQDHQRRMLLRLLGG